MAKITEQQKLLASTYLQTGQIKLAAEAAGYKSAHCAYVILARPHVKDFLTELRLQQDAGEKLQSLDSRALSLDVDKDWLILKLVHLVMEKGTRAGDSVRALALLSDLLGYSKAPPSSIITPCIIESPSGKKVYEFSQEFA